VAATQWAPWAELEIVQPGPAADQGPPMWPSQTHGHRSAEGGLSVIPLCSSLPVCRTAVREHMHLLTAAAVVVYYTCALGGEQNISQSGDQSAPLAYY